MAKPSGQIANKTVYCYNISDKWGCSSAGRAPPLHGGGQGFESPQLHIVPRILLMPVSPTLFIPRLTALLKDEPSSLAFFSYLIPAVPEG